MFVKKYEYENLKNLCKSQKNIIEEHEREIKNLIQGNPIHCIRAFCYGCSNAIFNRSNVVCGCKKAVVCYDFESKS